MSKNNVQILRDFFQRQGQGTGTPPVPQRTPPPVPPRPQPQRQRERGDGGPSGPLDPRTLSVRLSGITKRLTALEPELGTRGDAIKHEHEAIGALLGDQQRAQEAKDRLDQLEPQILPLERQVAIERKAQTSQTELKDFLEGRGDQRRELNTKANQAKGDIDTALSSVDDNVEKIKRKGIIFDSKDKAYHETVTKKMKELLPRVKAALDDPAHLTKELEKEVSDLGSSLYQARLHYEDMTGVTKKEHIAQRQAKASAIKEHEEQLMSLARQLSALRKQSAAPLLSALTANSELAATDPEAARDQATDLGKALMDDPVLRKTVFENATESTGPSLVLALNSLPSDDVDAVIGDLVQTRGQTSLPLSLSTTSIRQEAEKVRQNPGLNPMGSFFRGNTVATKLAKKTIEGSREGKDFLDGTKKLLEDRIAGINGNAEMSPDKRPETDPQAKQQALNRAKDANLAVTRGIIDDMTSDPEAVPMDVAKLADEFYQQALLTSGGNEEQAVTSAGGFVMLRLVVPLLGDEIKKINEALPNVRKKEEREKLENKKTAMLIQMKIMQNLSNGVKFGSKEPGFEGINVLFGDLPDNPAPEFTQLRGFMKSLSTRGKLAKMPLPDLDAILAKPAGLEAFRTFCKKLFSDENLEFWENAKDKPTGRAAQTVYDTYLAVNAPKAVNISSGPMNAFHNINGQPEPKPWNTAQWDQALSEIHANLTDSWNKLEKPENADDANAVKIAMQ
jgi:hypothetical protein